MLILFSFAVVAVPPSLENHQFYGVVHWDLTDTSAKEVTASVQGDLFKVDVATPTYCGENTCTGKFGYEPLLKVQGSDGETITFSINGVAVGTATYQAWEATELELSVATLSVDVPPCEEDWACSAFGMCLDGQKSKTCTDANGCSTQKTEVEACGLGVSVDEEAVPCSYEWDCSTWSVCASGQKSRSCERSDDCDALFTAGEASSITQIAKPSESQVCVVGLVEPPKTQTQPPKESPKESVVLKEEVEEVDEEEEEGGFPITLYIGGFIIFIVLLAGVWYFFLRKKESVPVQGY